MSVPATGIDEFDFLEETRERLRRAFEGRYIVIHGREVVGDFASKDEAFRGGVRACGARPFLIARLGPSGDRAWVPVLAELVEAGGVDEAFVPHSWRRGAFLDDPPVWTDTPLPPGAGRRRAVRDTP